MGHPKGGNLGGRQQRGTGIVALPLFTLPRVPFYLSIAQAADVNTLVLKHTVYLDKEKAQTILYSSNDFWFMIRVVVRLVIPHLVTQMNKAV